jgi:hypothetical protein
MADVQISEVDAKLAPLNVNVIIIVVIIIFHHKFRPGWPVSVSAFTSSSNLFSGHPGHHLNFG